MPFFIRRQKGRAWQQMDLIDQKRFESEPQYFEPANSAAGVLPTAPTPFKLTLNPATGFLLWQLLDSRHPGERNKPYARYGKPAPESTLVDDLNHLFVAAEKHLEKKQAKADLCAVGFEIEAGKLHLA